MPNEPKSHRRPKRTLMWRLRETMDRVWRRVGKVLGNSAETFEWMMHRLMRLFMPWTWFQPSDDDYEQEFPREVKVGATESFEFLFHRVLRTISKCMPWNWFAKRDRSDKAAEAITGESSNSLAEYFEWRIGTTFEAINDIFASIFKILVPQKVVKSTAAAQQALTDTTLDTAATVQRRFGRLVERILPKRFFWPLYRVFDFAWYSFDFVSEWWWSREYAKLTWAVPAVGMMGLIGATSLLSYWNSESSRIAHYQMALQQAQQDEDIERTVLLKTKLEQLGFGRLDAVEFRAAIKLAQDERFEEAYEKMTGIAPRNEPGMLQGHLWIASEILNGRVKPKSETGELLDPWKVFGDHVKQALSLERENVMARRFHIEWLMHRNDIPAAIVSMESLVNEYPDFHATLAHLCNSIGNRTKGRLHARRAISHFGGLASATQQIDTPTESKGLTALGCLRMAEAYHLVNQPEQELKTLETGGRLFPNHREIQAALMGVRLNRLATLKYNDGEFARIVEDICRLDKNRQEVVRTLVRGILAMESPSLAAEIGLDLSRLQGQEREVVAESARTIVRSLQSKNLLSPDVFERIGNFYLVKQDFPRAISYVRKACELNPSSDSAWNNLAWMLNHEKVADFENALDAANKAVALNPDSGNMETRAQVYMNLQQWSEAAADLEVALAGGTLSNVLAAHESLAECYEASGMPEQAQAHRAILAAAPKEVRN